MKVVNLKSEYKKNPLGLHDLPRLSWEISSEQRNVRQTAYEIHVVSNQKQSGGSGELIWSSGKVNSDKSIHVSYEGPRLISGQKVYWKVRVWDNHGNEAESEEVASWEMGLLDQAEWTAEWITFPWENNLDQSAPCPYLRKEFTVYKPIASARIYASGLGLYELELNGEKVGDQLFTPGWTNYKERLQYQVYDVTGLVHPGENGIGSILGDGWYRGHFGWWENNRNYYGDTVALLLQLKLTYEDGAEEWVLSDNSWKASSGPILKSDIYHGETYDARLEKPGWSVSGFDERGWQSVSIYKHTKETLVSSIGEPIRKTKEVKPKKIFITPKGEQVLDLGQNMVGWVRLKVSGNAGDEIILRFAEVLDQEGNFYTENLRNIECTDRYILKGSGEEVYEPRFTFHGFRYVLVEGYPGMIESDSVTGIVVHSDMEETGSFECSDPLINQLQSNIQWGQRGNFLDVPTDCPQRDERLGWTGDAQVFAPTACFNFNSALFFTKWLKDLKTEQRADGSVPWVVPNIIENGGGTGWSDGFGATGWADAAVVIPWTIYQYYGDEKILADQYDSMKSWVEYMVIHAGESYIFDYGFHFGDWLSFAEYYSYNYNAPDYGYAGAHTDKSLLATAYFYYSTGLLQRTAEILGKPEDADYFASLLPKIKEAWNREFVTESGRLVSATQTAYAIALCFGLISEDKKDIIGKRLAEDVRHFGHLTTGFLGAPLLNFALSEAGYTDLAYQLLANKRYPSWLYPITMRATTIWERWDGIKPDGTFQTVGMNSFNHYAYGAIGDWMYSRMAGIQIDPVNPGFKQITFAPEPGGDLTYASAEIKTLYGEVKSKWERKGDEIALSVTIPPNCSGVVRLRTDSSTLHVDGSLFTEFEEHKQGLLSFELGSGNYQLKYAIAK